MAAVASLGLSEWVTELAVANQLFEDVFLETTRECALAPGETFSQLRPQAHAAWYALCHHLNAHALVYSDKGRYTQAIEHMNGLLESYRVLAAGRRRGRKVVMKEEMIG
jgi:hypothetical protein